MFLEFFNHFRIFSLCFCSEIVDLLHLWAPWGGRVGYKFKQQQQHEIKREQVKFCIFPLPWQIILHQHVSPISININCSSSVWYSCLYHPACIIKLTSSEKRVACSLLHFHVWRLILMYEEGWRRNFSKLERTCKILHLLFSVINQLAESQIELQMWKSLHCWSNSPPVPEYIDFKLIPTE